MQKLIPSTFPATIKQALPKMIADGYEFVTVSGLFAAKGITPAADREVIYSRDFPRV